MRPISLTLEGFTAFREPAAVNFEGLHLMAITGPNGAGKSSILDAMLLALFGRAPRMKGKQSKEFISHGKNEFKIGFRFQVDNARYRVQRRYFKKGAPQVRLEVHQGEGSWRTLTDKVEETDKAVVRLLRMGYDTFTKSVILPQGLFDQFLKGDKDKRREVLEEILSLKLFEKIGGLAGEKSRILKERTQQIELRLQELHRKTEQISADSLTKQLEQLQAENISLTEKKETLQRRRLEREKHLQHLKKLQALQEEEAIFFREQRQFDQSHETCREKVVLLEKKINAHTQLLTSTRTEREELQKGEFRFDLLNDRIEKLEKLKILWDEKERLPSKLETARKEFETIKAELDQARADKTQIENKIAQERKNSEEFNKKLWAAQLRDELQPGRPCPVCEQTVSRPPGSLPTPKHEIHLPSLEKDYQKILGKEGSLNTRLLRAQQDLEFMERRFNEIQTQAGPLEEELCADLGYPKVEILSKARNEFVLLRNQRQELKKLRQREETLSLELQGLREDLKKEELNFSLLDKEKSKFDALISRLKQEKQDIEEKMGQAGLKPVPLSATEKEINRLEIKALEDDLFALEKRNELIQLETGKIKQQLEYSEESKNQIKTLEADSASSRREETVCLTIYQDFQKNKLPDFLFSTVLSTLLNLAGEKFSRFSNGRYQLGLEGAGEIQVLDGWNANLPRSVESLSGGESFAASLSFALALSDYLQGRQKIQALFIDEGFGSLDRETRDNVAEILATLETEDKLIGVVTHIEELAELFPERIRLEKMPEGSRLLDPKPLQDEKDAGRISALVT